MACSHVAHDCVVGSNTILANCALLAGHAKVEDQAYISGQVVVHQFATIGRHAFVTGGSRVPRDAPPFMMLHGQESEVMCVNSTGLKRSGFASDVINALKDAHRVIWSSGLPLPDAIQTLKRMHNGHFKEVQYLIDFMLNSARGKNGRAREAMRGAHPSKCTQTE
jgi:UDP-N-acetylglucosamine acyltransferase